jgi:acetyl-CoA acetyltransferase
MARRPIASIVGAANSVDQDDASLTPAAHAAQAGVRALAQAGLTTRDVDGLFSASAYYYLPTLTLGEHLGITPSYSDSSNIGGCSFVAHLQHAAAAIATGRCSVALIAYASTQGTDAASGLRSMSEPLVYEAPHGPLWPITGFALRTQRHFHEFGTTSEQLAEIAVAAREWACLNPDVDVDQPLTVADVVGSRMICAPLHKLDCCLVTNGAGAVVVTAADRAADLVDDPVHVWGVAEAHDARSVSSIPDLVRTPATRTGPAAMRAAGIGIADVDVFQLYDAFTISVLLALEDLGVCPKGEGGPFVQDGVLRPGGGLAVNTSGGGLSARHPGMLGIHLLLEAVQQLRGTATGRQVPDAAVALVHGLGGVQTSAATAVLGRSDGSPT